MKERDRMCYLCVAYILVDGQETEVKCIACQMVISKARKQAQEPKWGGGRGTFNQRL